jgi:hypothetical protein
MRRAALKSSLVVRELYYPAERLAVIRAFRLWRAEAEIVVGESLSAFAIERMIDEAFMRYHDWLSEKNSANFKTLFIDRLDQKTIRSLLTCELSFRRLRRFKVGTIKLVDGFLQVMRIDPLPYLDLDGGFSRDPSPP